MARCGTVSHLVQISSNIYCIYCYFTIYSDIIYIITSFTIAFLFPTHLSLHITGRIPAICYFFSITITINFIFSTTHYFTLYNKQIFIHMFNYVQSPSPSFSNPSTCVSQRSGEAVVFARPPPGFWHKKPVQSQNL